MAETGSGSEVGIAAVGAAQGEEAVGAAEAEMTVSKKEQLQEEAKTLGHLMSHRPFNPFCRACVEGRTRKKPRRKGA